MNREYIISTCLIHFYHLLVCIIIEHEYYKYKKNDFYSVICNTNLIIIKSDKYPSLSCIILYIMVDGNSFHYYIYHYHLSFLRH